MSFSQPRSGTPMTFGPWMRPASKNAAPPMSNSCRSVPALVHAPALFDAIAERAGEEILLTTGEIPTPADRCAADRGVAVGPPQRQGFTHQQRPAETELQILGAIDQFQIARGDEVV